IYSQVSAYSAATGNDTRTRQADPRFVRPSSGDFHPQAGSPAIDDADASVASWPAFDLAGAPRVDDPQSPNTGFGSPAFADRGPFEFSPGTPTDSPPVVNAPSSVSFTESTTVTVNVTASDPNGDPITSLSADLTSLPAVNDAVFVKNGTNTAGTLTWHTTRNDGRTAPYPVTFTASNALTGTATTQVQVIDVPDRAPVVTAPTNVHVARGASVVV